MSEMFNCIGYDIYLINIKKIKHLTKNNQNSVLFQYSSLAKIEYW